jgi:pheromone shutdown-related protein TraB
METPPETETAGNHMVHHLSWQGKNITLIGTAHVSRQSALLVEQSILEEQPETVCVELCATRLSAMRDSDKWRNMDIVKVIKEKKSLMLFMNLVLASFQKRMADKFDIRPGQEMINAIEAAGQINAQVIPVDREIQITLARVWRGMGIFAKFKLLVQMIFSLWASDDIKEEDIEKMKEEDILQTLLADVKKSHPIIEKVLIDERDRFMAQTIRTAPGEKITAVVGAAHVPGIKRYLRQETLTPVETLNQVPPPSFAGKWLKWILPAVILILFIAGFLMEGKHAGADMIWIWIAANGLFAGIGATIAFAHPLTIVSAVLAAPLTSLNPMIAAGWVSGLVEAFTRKPKVRDLEAIPKDILTIRGFWKNNVTRILLVVIFTNLGSSLGTMTALPLMLRIING